MIPRPLRRPGGDPFTPRGTGGPDKPRPTTTKPIAVLVLAAVFFFPVPAQAKTVLSGSVPNLPAYQAAIDHSLVPTPDARTTIRIVSDSHGWSLDSVGRDGAKPRAPFYVDAPVPQTDPFASYYPDHLYWEGEMHEIGHLFDVLVLSTHDRREFARLVGFPRGPWSTDRKHRWLPYGMDAEWTPMEDFAAAYGQCAVDGWSAATIATDSMQTGLALAGLDSTSYVKTCEMIRRIAAEHHLN